MRPEQLFKCLSDQTRLDLVLRIYSKGEACVCELTDDLGKNQPTISRHLAQLRNCGILRDRRDSQWVYYSLEPGLADWALSTIEAAHQARQQENYLALSSEAGSIINNRKN